MRGLRYKQIYIDTPPVKSSVKHNAITKTWAVKNSDN